MNDDLDDLSIYDMFRMEAEEQVEQLQSRLLALKDGEANEATLRSLMRGAHSLKGAARVVGLNAAVRLTHAMEERFVAAQEGRNLLQFEVDTMFRSVDVLRELSAISEDEVPAWSAAKEDTISTLIAELTGEPAVAEGLSAAEPKETIPSSEDQPKAAPETSETDRTTGDFNLRITSQRFDRIIAMSSDNLVQSQALVRLQEQMQRIQRRLERLVRSVADARRKGARPREAGRCARHHHAPGRDRSCQARRPTA